jgi:hypothetical protein
VSGASSHGPAAIDGGSKIAEDAPAQVMTEDVGGTEVQASRLFRTRHDHEVEETGHEPHPGGKPANLMLLHLADALGSLTRYSREALLGVVATGCGAFFCDTLAEHELIRR